MVFKALMDLDSWLGFNDHVSSPLFVAPTKKKFQKNLKFHVNNLANRLYFN
jgi:hypothetical protein